VDLIELTQDKVQLRSFVSTVMNILVPQMRESLNQLSNYPFFLECSAHGDTLFCYMFMINEY